MTLTDQEIKAIDKEAEIATEAVWGEYWQDGSDTNSANWNNGYKAALQQGRIKAKKLLEGIEAIVRYFERTFDKDELQINPCYQAAKKLINEYQKTQP